MTGQNTAPVEGAENLDQYKVDAEYAKMFDEISGTSGPAYEEEVARVTEIDENGQEVDGDGVPIQADPDPEVDEKEDEQQPAPEGDEGSDDPKPKEGEQDDGEDSSDDPIAKLQKQLDEARAANRLAQHKDKSNRGRLSALTKKVDELQAALEEANNKASNEAAPDPSQLPDPDDDEGWKELEEQYPKFAKKFDARIVSRMKALGLQLQKPQEKEGKAAPEAAQQPARNDAYLAEQARILERAYPNYREIGQDPFFHEFLDTLTDRQRDLAKSDDASDVIHLIRNLYTPYYNKYHPQGNTSAGASSDRGAAESEASSAAERAAERRRKVLEDTEVRGQQQRFSPGPDLDREVGTSDNPGPGYINLFDKIAKQKAKESV